MHDLLGYQLAQASIVTTAAFLRRVAKPMGLGPVEFTILHLVKENQDVTTSRLARALAITPPAITAWIGKLEQRGWVRREPSANDRRSQHLRLTREGDALVSGALKALLDEDDATLTHLSAAERGMLLELLRKVAHHRGAGA